MTNQILLIKQDTQESVTHLDEVKKRFPRHDSLFLYRLVKRAIFICNRCTLEKTSKLAEYVKDEKNKPLCNDCYDYLLFASGYEQSPDRRLRMSGNKNARSRAAQFYDQELYKVGRQALTNDVYAMTHANHNSQGDYIKTKNVTSFESLIDEDAEWRVESMTVEAKEQQQAQQRESRKRRARKRHDKWKREAGQEICIDLLKNVKKSSQRLGYLRRASDPYRYEIERRESHS
jgi:hypothetical protein